MGTLLEASFQLMTRRGAVCIVEDDADIRETLRELLEMEGFSVLTAGNGQEALELLSRKPSQLSLILLDLMMPVMDGWEFMHLAKTRSDTAPVPIVVMSAIADPTKLKGTPAKAFIRKPVDIDALLRVVSRFTQPDRHAELEGSA